MTQQIVREYFQSFFYKEVMRLHFQGLAQYGSRNPSQNRKNSNIA